jgi:hypothetical protein
MKANELRLGNHVEYKGRIYPIASIHADNTLRLKCDDSTHENYSNGTIGCYSLRDVNPIPITKEFMNLTKAEYKETERADNWYFGKLRITIPTEGRNKGKVYVNFQNIVSMVIQYFHELENVYFIFWGEELFRVNKSTERTDESK